MRHVVVGLSLLVGIVTTWLVGRLGWSTYPPSVVGALAAFAAAFLFAGWVLAYRNLRAIRQFRWAAGVMLAFLTVGTVSDSLWSGRSQRRMLRALDSTKAEVLGMRPEEHNEITIALLRNGQRVVQKNVAPDAPKDGALRIGDSIVVYFSRDEPAQLVTRRPTADAERELFVALPLFVGLMFAWLFGYGGAVLRYLMEHKKRRASAA